LANPEIARAGAASRTKEEETAAQRFAERQRELQNQILAEIDKRRAVEATLAEALNGREVAEKRQAATTAAAVAQARELEASLVAARQDIESKTAGLDRLVTREAELTSMLAEARATRETLERRLSATEAAVLDSENRSTSERLAAEKRAADR